MESSRKLGDFNFYWTKTLYQNILSHITFFLHFSSVTFILFYFEQYLFSEAGWMGPWWKEKTAQKTITDKKNWNN